MVATVAAGSLIFAAAGPAAADLVEGAGAGTGGDISTETTPADCGENPLAAEVTQYQLISDNIGTYSGLDDNTGLPVVYAGETRLKVEVPSTETPFFYSPLGTHGDGSVGACLVPVPIPITAEVTSSSPDGNVTCGGEGTLIRVQSAVTIAFTGTCEIDGNRLGFLGHASGPVAHVVEGALEPCFILDIAAPEVCDGTPYGSLWEGTYTAAPLG